MPPRAQNPDELDVSVRLKHGKNTVFLLVDPLEPFGKLTDELLEVLRERYPDGLSASSGDIIPIPAPGDDFKVSYAKMSNPNDPAQGWKNLKVKKSDTPVSLGVKNGTVLGFAIQSDEDADEDVEFYVEWPSLEEAEE